MPGSLVIARDAAALMAAGASLRRRGQTEHGVHVENELATWMSHRLQMALVIAALGLAACARQDAPPAATLQETPHSPTGGHDTEGLPAEAPPAINAWMDTDIGLEADVFNDASRYGLGVVGKEVSGELDCGTSSSERREVDLYPAPGESAVAKLKWRSSEDGTCITMLATQSKTKPLRFTLDLKEISYESAALVYYESRDGFARILANQANPGLWVRVADIPDGKLHPWVVLLTESPRNYHEYEGRTVHGEPEQQAPVLVTLRDRDVQRENVHELIPTGSTVGGWGQFEVIEYDGDFNIMTRTREPKLTGNKWTGWIRLVDENDQPIIWYYTRD